MLLRSNCLRHIQHQNLWKCQAQLYQLSDTTFYSTSSVFHNLSSLTQTHAVISSPKRIIFFLTKWSFIGLKSFTTTKHQITSDFVLSMDNFSHWAKLEPLSERQHPWGDLGLCALLKVTISGYQPLVNYYWCSFSQSHTFYQNWDFVTTYDRSCWGGRRVRACWTAWNVLPHIMTPVWGVKQTKREIEKDSGNICKLSKARGQHRLKERGKTEKIASRTMGERHIWWNLSLNQRMQDRHG